MDNEQECIQLSKYENTHSIRIEILQNKPLISFTQTQKKT